MDHGHIAILKRPKRKLQVVVMRDHTQDNPSFPAITVRLGQEEWIVKPEELLSWEDYQAELEAQKKAKHQADCESVADIVASFQAGNISLGAIAKAMGTSPIKLLSRARKAERLGLIKLVKPKG